MLLRIVIVHTGEIMNKDIFQIIDDKLNYSNKPNIINI